MGEVSRNGWSTFEDYLERNPRVRARILSSPPAHTWYRPIISGAETIRICREIEDRIAAEAVTSPTRP